MDNKQLLLNIENQPYKIQINSDTDSLDIMLTNTVTKTSYACGLDNESIYNITKDGKFIRNVEQFCSFLEKSALNEPNGAFSLIGKINSMDNELILTINVKLGFDDKEIITYVIKLSKINKETSLRVEEMALDIYESYAKKIGSLDNFINNFNSEIENLYTLIDNTTQSNNELVQMVNNTKIDISQSIIDISQSINSTKNELVQMVNDTKIDITQSNNITRNELVQMVNDTKNGLTELIQVTNNIRELLTKHGID